MTYHVMRGWKRNYRKNFRISSEGDSINTIISRYSKSNENFLEIGKYSTYCKEWVKKGWSSGDKEARVTLTDAGNEFFEMYHRAIELWYERDFLNKYDKTN